MTTWTLADIRSKVRKVTGRLSGSELSNDQLDEYINKYYLYTFPAEVKLDKKLVEYTFVTDENQPTYTMPDTTYTNFGPKAYVNNIELDWFQNPDVFNQLNPVQYTFNTAWTGDGATIAFSTTASVYPIYPGTLTISDGTELFRDTNTTYTTSNVNLVGTLGGSATINYSTGVISVTFNTAPTNGDDINLNYASFNPGRPVSILMYDSTFTLHPPPNQQYIISMQAWKIVDELTSATDTPDLSEWGPAIAYGASRDILADYAEMGRYQEVDLLYRQEIDYILTRTAQNLSNQRSLPNF